MLEKSKKYKSNLGIVEIITVTHDDAKYPIIGVIEGIPLLFTKEGVSLGGFVTIKKKSLRTFLENEGIGWYAFLDNCLTKNQRWERLNLYYSNINELKARDPHLWLYHAFSWLYSSFGIKKMLILQKKWKNYCDENTLFD